MLVNAAAACHASLPSPAPWRARLELVYEKRGARTVLVRRSHAGPLVVQKSLYPEGDAPCQNVVVHPPGGIAGGDELHLSATVAAGAHVQFTTPGASKWYRSAGATAQQTVELRVGASAVVEWLPQETVVFDGAIAKLHTRVDLLPGASFIGWDVICLGRTAGGERFVHGRLRQELELWSQDTLVWTERSLMDGDAQLLHSPLGLQGQPVFGTFIAAGGPVDDETLNLCRGIAAVSGEVGTTRLPGVLLARYRGASTEAARACFVALWSVVRPRLVGRAAVAPRIWNT